MMRRDLPLTAIRYGRVIGGMASLVDILIETLTVHLEEQARLHGRGVRLRALRQRRRWKKADVPRLLQMPGPASQATQRRIGRLLSQQGKALGRGVIPEPKGLDQRWLEAWTFALRLWCPDIAATERRRLYRQTRWFSCLIESSYRGERQRLQFMKRRASLHRYDRDRDWSAAQFPTCANPINEAIVAIFVEMTVRCSVEPA